MAKTVAGESLRLEANPKNGKQSLERLKVLSMGRGGHVGKAVESILAELHNEWSISGGSSYIRPSTLIIWYRVQLKGL